MVGGGLQHFSVSPSTLFFNWAGLGLGLGGLGTKGLGPGLDNQSDFNNDILYRRTMSVWMARI